jgi:hypothetical protein
MAGIYRKPVMAGVMLTGVVLTGVLTGGPSAARASASACPAGQITGSAATPTGAGYWLVDSGGDVFSFGDARFAGSVAYIQSRYGTPCQAWAYWQARRYYGPLLAGVLGAD